MNPTCNLRWFRPVLIQVQYAYETFSIKRSLWFSSFGVGPEILHCKQVPWWMLLSVGHTLSSKYLYRAKWHWKHLLNYDNNIYCLLYVKHYTTLHALASIISIYSSKSFLVIIILVLQKGELRLRGELAQALTNTHWQILAGRAGIWVRFMSPKRPDFFPLELQLQSSLQCKETEIKENTFCVQALKNFMLLKCPYCPKWFNAVSIKNHTVNFYRNLKNEC